MLFSLEIFVPICHKRLTQALFEHACNLFVTSLSFFYLRV